MRQIDDNLNSKFKTWIIKNWGTKYIKDINKFDIQTFKKNGSYDSIPYSYNDIYSLFILKDQLKDGFSKFNFNEEDDQDEDNNKEEELKNHYGEISLETIGTYLGDLSATAIKELETSGKAKFKFFGIQKNNIFQDNLDIDQEEWNEILDDSINIYIDLLMEPKWNYESFLSNLEQEKYISKSEYKPLLRLEKQTVEYLRSKLIEGSIQLARAFIEEDFNEEKSLIKSFQNVFAKNWEERLNYKKPIKKKKTIDDF